MGIFRFFSGIEGSPAPHFCIRKVAEFCIFRLSLVFDVDEKDMSRVLMVHEKADRVDLVINTFWRVRGNLGINKNFMRLPHAILQERDIGCCTVQQGVLGRLRLEQGISQQRVIQFIPKMAHNLA
jgi:hypothetical protein